MNVDVRIKSKALIVELESYLLEITKNIETSNNIDFWLNKINIVIVKLDQMHNGELKSSIITNK
jgi:hypothetical protein